MAGITLKFQNSYQIRKRKYIGLKKYIWTAYQKVCKLGRDDILCTAGKFDGELNLAVWQSGLKTAKLKSVNIISYACNDVMHAVAQR